MQHDTTSLRLRGTFMLADFVRFYYFNSFYAALWWPAVWIWAAFLPLPWSVIVLSYAAWQLIAPYYYAKKIMSRHAASTEITQTLEPDGIHSWATESSSVIGWSLIDKVLETRRMFVFRFSSMSAFHVPKRFFESPQAESEFKRVLTQYVGADKFESPGPLGRLL